jgi:WD40 repeat protein
MGLKTSSPRDSQPAIAANRYDAFISYSHAADGALAPALRNGLQRFATPWRVFRLTNPTRSLRVFQDQASLSANPKLWPTIEGALAGSSWFVLLASPVAASSPWVNKEVEFWCEHKTLDTLLIVQTDGEIAWSASAGDFDWSSTTALPRPLVGRFQDEPRWIEARWARTSGQTTLRDPRFRDLVAELAAPLRGVPKDELIGEDIRQARRLAWWRNVGFAAITVALLIAIAAAVVAYRERDLAEARLATAQTNESKTLATLAEIELDGDGPATAIRIALAALPRREGDRPYVAQAEAALLHGVERLRERRRFFRQGTGIGDYALSPDGRTIALGFDDGQIELWDVASGKPVHVLRRADASVRSSKSDKGGLHIEQTTDTTDGVLHAAFTADGKTLITVDSAAEVRCWDVASGKELASLLTVRQMGLTSFGLEADVSPDGRFVALIKAARRNPEGVPDTAVAPLWNVTSGKTTLLEHELDPAERRYGGSYMVFAAFSADSRLLVTSSSDSSVRVWDAASLREVARLRGHRANLTFAWFSPDGRSLLTAAEDHTARLWEVPSGKPIGILRHQAGVIRAAVDPRGRLLVTATDDRMVRVWDLASGKELGMLRGHDGTLSSIAFSPDGQRIVTTASDKTLRIWDAASTKELFLLRADVSMSEGIFMPDGRSVLTNADESVRMWDITPALESGSVIPGHDEPITSIVFGPDGRSLLTAAWDETARIRDLGSLTETAVLRHPQLIVESAVFSADGRLVLTTTGRHCEPGALIDACSPVVARVWDVPSQTEVPAVRSARPMAVAGFGAGGRAIITVDGEGLIWGRDTSSGAQAIETHRVPEYKGPDGRIGSFRRPIAFSPDGRTLLVEWANGVVGLWSLESRRVVSALGQVNVRRSAFTRDGRRVVTDDGTGETSVWDTASGGRLTPLRRGSLTALAFSPDGSTVATVAVGGEISLSDATQGDQLIVLGSHSGADAIAFSPDGRTVATAARDIRLWRVMPRGRALIDFACTQVPWPLTDRQKERFGVTDEWCAPEVADALRARVR